MSRLRVLELYCGIGGCAAALGPNSEVACAVDINQSAVDVYRLNFPHPVEVAAIESIRAHQWRNWNADLWWMSPPCQPYSVRGLRRDLDDPRAASFVATVERLTDARPRYVGLENVPGFRGSRAHAMLTDRLRAAGYQHREYLLCPSQFGQPNRRMRFYLVATRDRTLNPIHPSPPATVRRVREFLDDAPAPELAVPQTLVSQYREALHVVDADDPKAETHCFTSAYGRSPVRSGSYLVTADGVRRFSPAEIVRILGFPATFRLPDKPASRLWPLVGNSLSVRVVRAVLGAFPELSCHP